MSDLEENIKRINNKLQQLLKHYHQLQREKEQLTTTINGLKLLHENDQARITELEQQAGILKSAAGKMNEPDKKLFEKHINQYIREIDKCIGLLSE